MTTIKQVMPAPGWRVFEIYKDDDNTIGIEEFLVIGWALLDTDQLMDLLLWEDREVHLLECLDAIRRKSVFEVVTPTDVLNENTRSRWRRRLEAYLEENDWVDRDKAS